MDATPLDHIRIGNEVMLPSGRIGRVIDQLTSGRMRVRYAGADEDDTCDLWPHMLMCLSERRQRGK